MTTAWRARFGDDPPSGAARLERFLAHRSVRRFTSAPIEEATVAALIAAAQSASTSSGLQLWTAISVQSPKRRAAIAQLCAGQSHVKDAAWFFAFCADHHRLEAATRAVGQDPAGLDYEEFYIMAIIDAAIAAERMVCAAESLGIGVCYIGALRNDVAGVRNLLELPTGTIGLFGLCLGWPEADAVDEIKPRLHQAALWHKETYQEDVSSAIEDYNQRMAEHYAARGMDPKVTWSMRMGRRVDGSAQSLSGRQSLGDWVRAMGFAKR